MQDTLLDLAVNPVVVDDEEIRAGTVGLSANEQVSLPCHHGIRINMPKAIGIYNLLSESCDTRILRLEHRDHMESITCGQSFRSTVEDDLELGLLSKARRTKKSRGLRPRGMKYGYERDDKKKKNLSVR